MYSNLKNVQYLLAGLKAYNISKIVISPGNSHNAIVRSFEEDDYFTTYNIVDERSAAFFACGLCQEFHEPIALCCTSGTAATNYMSGVTEAYRRSLPLVVITGDKNQYYLAQYEDQMIDAISIFKSIVRYDCVLPLTENEKDLWYCQRVINQTLHELNHHGSGPVHIDVPIEYGNLAIGESFTTKELPDFKKIYLHDLVDEKEVWKNLFDELNEKRILIICGQDDHISSYEVKLIEKISHRYNCVFAVDKLSNLHCSGVIEITRASKRLEQQLEKSWPDYIISIAGNPVIDYKYLLKKDYVQANHWIVNCEGRIADPFKKLTRVFEGTTVQFLEKMALYGCETASSEYFDFWKSNYDEVVIPKFNYSNLYTVQRLMNMMPQNSNFNISNSTTIRIAQFFDLDPSIQVYCNRGVNGIDGCVSTFIGQAAASPDKMNFLIVGDLTFFYDMNSIWNRYVGKNVRIMLNNNEGASLFHFNQGLANYPLLNENVAAEHFATAKGWVESQGFSYISAQNKEEFDERLQQFLSSDSERPIFFEVFTHKDEDARLQHKFYDDVIFRDGTGAIKHSAKKMLKSVLGEENIQKLKELL